MSLRTYVLKRIGLIFFTLFGLSLFVFLLSRLIPGNPARWAVGPSAPEELVQEMERRLNLDKPIYAQYVLWLGDVLRGDFGYSVYSRRSTTTDLLEFLPVTLELVVLSMIFIVIGTLVFGAIAGRWAYKWPDTLVRGFAYIGIAMPTFGWAIILQFIFAWQLGWFPLKGIFSSDAIRPPRITGFVFLDCLITGNFAGALDYLWHLALPALAVALPNIAQGARLLRTGIVENINKDYILLAVSHGLPERVLMSKYLLKPSVIPTVSVLGMTVAALIVNTFPVEMVFNIPGLSKYAITVLLWKDLNPIVAVVLVVGLFYAIMNLLTDIVVAYLDPRVVHLERDKGAA